MNAGRLLARFMALSIRAQMQYRASFLLMSLGQFVATATEMVAIWALFQRFGSLTPWTLPHVAFFYGMVNTSFAITEAASRGFDQFGTLFIKTGNFDRLLLRPRSTVLQLAGHEFQLMRMGRLVQGALVLAWAVTNLDVDWNLARGALLLFTFVAIAALFYALVICTAVLSFWTTESLEVMNALTYGGVETAQYPMAIYTKYFRRFFTLVVPLACVAYFPAVAILGVTDPLGSSLTFQALAPLAGFVFFGATLVLWRYAARYYTSTGS